MLCARFSRLPGLLLRSFQVYFWWIHRATRQHQAPRSATGKMAFSLLNAFLLWKSNENSIIKRISSTIKARTWSYRWTLIERRLSICWVPHPIIIIIIAWQRIIFPIFFAPSLCFSFISCSLSKNEQFSIIVSWNLCNKLTVAIIIVLKIESASVCKLQSSNLLLTVVSAGLKW